MAEDAEYVIGKLAGGKYTVAKFTGNDRPATAYSLELTSKGITCDCPAWQFSKTKPRSCKHTKMLQAAIDEGRA